MIHLSLFSKDTHIHKHMYRRHINYILHWEQNSCFYMSQPERKELLVERCSVCYSVCKLHIFIWMLHPQQAIGMHGKKKHLPHNPVSMSLLLLHVISMLKITASTHL